MIRILHVVGRMNRGGVETWLMHVLRNIDHREFRMDFLVHAEEPGAYDDEIRALGSNVIPCLHPRHPWTYARNFKRILHEYGPYDVIHSHVHHYSGYVLRLARPSGVPVRIAHSHSDPGPSEAGTGPARRAYLAVMKRWIDRHATEGFACSSQAGASLFGRLWGVDPRWKILYCGIDLAPFRVRPDAGVVRAELGIPSDAFVVGHVGRFMDPKNHAFLLDIAAEVIGREPAVRFLLVGDGPLRPAIEAKARQLKLDRHVLFAGARPDIPRLMLAAMNAFLFPSLYEGLGLVMIEAQAAGLPCISSEAVPQEAILAGSTVQRLSLSQSAAVWADAVLVARSAPPRTAGLDPVSVVQRSPFAIERSLETLRALYSVA